MQYPSCVHGISTLYPAVIHTYKVQEHQKFDTFQHHPCSAGQSNSFVIFANFSSAYHISLQGESPGDEGHWLSICAGGGQKDRFTDGVK